MLPPTSSKLSRRSIPWSSASTPSLGLEPRDRVADALLLVGRRGHRERLGIVLDRGLLVALDAVGFGEAVVDVPGRGVLLDVALEDRQRLVDLLLAEQLVSVVVEVGLGRDLERPVEKPLRGLRVAL